MGVPVGTRIARTWIQPLANPWVFVGLTGGALTQALLLHGSVPDAGWALYPTFLAGGVAAWLAWPIVCVFVASALPHGYRSLRFVLYFVVGYVSWSVLTHLVALLLKRTLATGIDLPFSDGTLTHSLSREAPKDLVTFAWLCAARTAYCLIEQERHEVGENGPTDIAHHEVEHEA